MPWVALDYAADLSVPILDRGRNARKKGDRLLYHVPTVYMCRPNYYKIIDKKLRIFIQPCFELNYHNIFTCYRNKK